MSALTKIFVVLVVILAIVQTAGMVVWVNRSQNYVTTQNKLSSDLKIANARASSAEAQHDVDKAALVQVQTAMQKQIDAERVAGDQLKTALADRDTQIAQLNSNLAQATAAQKSSVDALGVAQKTLDTQNAAMADLRKSNLDLNNRVVEQAVAINEMTNKYEVADRQWKDAQEQITQLQSDNQKKDVMLHQHGISESTPPVNGESLVRVEGIVRARQEIGGVPYATISIGSADQVTKGMQFKVIDPQAKDPFLGYLIVDRVEPNEAIGHLTGPRVNDVRPGVEVRTQL